MKRSVFYLLFILLTIVSGLKERYVIFRVVLLALLTHAYVSSKWKDWEQIVFQHCLSSGANPGIVRQPLRYQATHIHM